MRCLQAAFFRVAFFISSTAILFGSLCILADAANDLPIHGLWVWKGPSVIQSPADAEKLRDFCRSQGVNEVYISVSEHGDMSGMGRFTGLIDLLHRSNIRVEALLSSENADEPGKHREKLLDHVHQIVQFNQSHPKNRFDGIHLDIEPQQRPENKGPGNLRFVPGLVEAFRAVRAAAEPSGLHVSADIQNKLLKGDLSERTMLLTSLPRFTLMLYEISSPTDGDNLEKKVEKLRTASQKFLDMAYDGVREPNLAKMVIALRTPDYGADLPNMLKTLDDSNGANPHYAGWARHSYNDALSAH
ncbi:MAG: hypothetical protein WBV46_03890 [Terriglobales bacterium]|jgi:hypothetical protein